MVITSYQYPQYLYAFNNDEDAEQLPNGSWKETVPSWELKAACREETNGKGSTIHTANGKTLVFASLIQLPKGTARINEGTEVLVTREEVDPNQLLEPGFIDSAKISGLVVAKGICEKYDYGRLHCRLWI
jgi:hypothetical protein